MPCARGHGVSAHLPRTTTKHRPSSCQIGRHLGVGSRLATDVGLVGLIDQISASLTVPYESTEQRNAHRAHVRDVVTVYPARSRGQQVVDQTGELNVLVDKAPYRTRAARHGGEHLTMQAPRPLGELDVLAQVRGQLNKGDVDTLRPGLNPPGRRSSQRLLERRQRFTQLGAVGTDSLITRRRQGHDGIHG